MILKTTLLFIFFGVYLNGFSQGDLNSQGDEFRLRFYCNIVNVNRFDESKPLPLWGGKPKVDKKEYSILGGSIYKFEQRQFFRNTEKSNLLTETSHIDSSVYVLFNFVNYDGKEIKIKKTTYPPNDKLTARVDVFQEDKWQKLCDVYLSADRDWSIKKNHIADIDLLYPHSFNGKPFQAKLIFSTKRGSEIESQEFTIWLSDADFKKIQGYEKNKK